MQPIHVCPHVVVAIPTTKLQTILALPVTQFVQLVHHTLLPHVLHVLKLLVDSNYILIKMSESLNVDYHTMKMKTIINVKGVHLKL